MEDLENKQLFRLQHIVPQDFSSSRASSHSALNSKSTPEIDEPHGPEEIEFQMPWGKVAGKAWGPPSGRPVLALHGWLDNAASFNQLIPLLPNDLRVICIDIPGHGYSDHFPLEMQYHYIDSLPAIQRLIKQLNWERFYLIGHSLGGGLALLYAEIFPEKVEKLVLLDILRIETTRPATIGIRLRKSTTSILKEEQAIKSGAEKPCSYEIALKRTKIGDGYVFRRDRRLRAAPLDFAPKEDQLVLAKQVTAEVLIIKFKNGPYFESPQCYSEQIEALKSKSRKFEYHQVEGYHHAHLTHPKRVAPLISAFFGPLPKRTLTNQST